MRTISRLITQLSVLAVCSSPSQTSPVGPEYRQECIVWDNVTQILNHHRGTLMACNKNTQCTGYDCSGIYQYQGRYTAYTPVQLNYCFGVAVHPCHNPVDLHFYVDMPDNGVHFQQTVANTTDVRIPGLHYDIPGIGTVDGYVSVHMERVLVNSRRYVIIGMVFKIRAQGELAKIGEWPKSMQQTLMPLTEIPVPECEKDVVTRSHNTADCHKYTTMTPPVHASTTTTHAPRGKPCGNSEGYVCPERMRCSSNRCVCMSKYVDNGTTCVLRVVSHMTTTPILIPEPDGQPIIGDGGNSSNKMPIIIGVSVGCVVVVIAIIGGILFVKYRNHQIRYGNHQPLINNEEQEDDDDDDPIDVST